MCYVFVLPTIALFKRVIQRETVCIFAGSDTWAHGDVRRDGLSVL